jgi:hypothetical protein
VNTDPRSEFDTFWVGLAIGLAAMIWIALAAAAHIASGKFNFGAWRSALRRPNPDPVMGRMRCSIYKSSAPLIADSMDSRGDRRVFLAGTEVFYDEDQTEEIIEFTIDQARYSVDRAAFMLAFSRRNL